VNSSCQGCRIKFMTHRMRSRENETPSAENGRKSSG
jgi:hypothetical protein